jgi:hypothetical protein
MLKLLSLANLWPLLIYWLVFFVACWSVVSMMQDWLYDEVTPRSELKVGAGTLIFALLATWLRPSFDTMFTNDVIWTILQALVWFAVFALVFQFHPWHAAGLALVTMALICGLATMGVESLTKPSQPVPPTQARPNNEPLRAPLNPVPTPAPK